MNEIVQRIKKVITYSELKVVRIVVEEIGDREEIVLVNGKIADQVGITRSVLVTGLRILEVAGVIETKSMGSRGTYIRVLNAEMLKKIAEM